MLGFMLGFIRDPEGLPPGGFTLLALPIPPALPPGPDSPCLVIGEDPGLPTPSPWEDPLDWVGPPPPPTPALPGFELLPCVMEASLDFIFPEDDE